MVVRCNLHGTPLSQQPVAPGLVVWGCNQCKLDDVYAAIALLKSAYDDEYQRGWNTAMEQVQSTLFTPGE